MLTARKHAPTSQAKSLTDLQLALRSGTPHDNLANTSSSLNEKKRTAVVLFSK